MGIQLNGTSDGLDIAPAPGQGEAYNVKESSWDPIQFQKHAIDMAAQNVARQRALEAKRHGEIDKWMKESNPVVKWDVDQQNYFAQRLKEHEDERVKLISDYKYNPPPEKMAELDRQMADIKQEANMTNSQQDQYLKAVAEGTKKKEDGQPYYDASSVHGIQFYGHPKDFATEKMVNRAGEVTTVGDELKKSGYKEGGNYKDNQAAIYRFRADNQHLLQPEPDWHFIQREGKILQEDKIEPTSQVVTGTYNGRKGTQTETKYTEGQINGLGAKLYNENPRKFAQQIQQTVLSQLGENDYDKFVKKTLIDAGIYEDQKDPNSEPTYTPKFQQTVSTDPKKAQSIIDQAISIKGHEVWFRNTHPNQVKGFNEFNKEPAGDKNKETTTIATHYGQVAQAVQQNPNLSPDQVAQQFNGKAVVDPSTGLYRVDIAVPPTTKAFVAVPASNILTMQGGKYRPNTQMSGQVAGTVTGNSIQWKKDGVTVTPNTPGAKPFAQLTYNPVQVDPNNADQLTQNYAMFMSANPNTSVSKEVYKKMLEDGKKVGNTFKVEYDLTDPVQRTYYDNVLGGTAISQTAFNKEAKAAKSSGATKPIVKTTPKNNDPLGILN